MRIAVAAAALLLAACASTQGTDDGPIPPVPAATPTALDQRLTDLQTAMTEMLERMDVLNDRIAKLESGAPLPSAAPLPATEAVAAPPRPTPAPPRAAAPTPRTEPSAPIQRAQTADNYRNALMLYGQGKVADSRRGFQQVFDSEPTGDLADNALFWIGETYFAAGDYASAMRFYRRVTVEFSDQNKAPDALFKIALAHEKTGDLAMARSTFEDVIRRYPYSSPAASAKLELKRIKY